VKNVRYTVDALAQLKRYGNMSARIRRAVSEYAANDGSRANMVIVMKNSPFSRLRVADFRVIFVETDDTIIVHKIVPRGDVYD
jgi:mRNA interferase RelE/StbE